MTESFHIAEMALAIGMGLVAGAASMLLYGRFSPQQRLQDLKSQAADLQQQMSNFDGEFSGAMTLARQNLRLSFKRLGLALGPSLLSGIPVLAAIPFIGSTYVSYFVAVAGAALAVKWSQNIS